jgi:hypothetical protein
MHTKRIAEFTETTKCWSGRHKEGDGKEEEKETIRNTEHV